MKKFFLSMMAIGLILVSAGCKKTDTVEPDQNGEDKQVEEQADVVSGRANVGAEVEAGGGEDSVKVKELESRVMELEKELKESKANEVVSGVGLDKNGNKMAPEEVRDNYEPAFITLDSPADGATFTNEDVVNPSNEEGMGGYVTKSITKVVFKGSVSPNTTKITVKASGGDRGDGEIKIGGGPWEDNYTLKKFKKGDTTFKYTAMMDYKNLGYGTNDYTFTAYFDNGAKKSTSVQIFLVQGGAEMGKPVIYLYPKKTSKVFVNVKPTEGISISEPEIGEGWNVIATPEGQILKDGKTYPYLFWEGYAANFKTPAEGFVTKVANVGKFFDEKLAVLGLNKKEIVDFKEYWVPILSEDPYYFITFIDQKEFEKYAPLTVEPKPDSVIRVFFDYKGLKKAVKVTEQKLKTAVRSGFSVIEWGGRLYR